MFTGTFTALITPFTADGTVDEKALRNLVEIQIKQGVNGVVPMGTTGESPTLSHEEHKEVIRIVVDQVAKRVPVIAGAGSNSTQEAIELTGTAHLLEADATLQVVPYYNKPSQEGLFLHFSDIADAVDLPQVLYNIPGRSGVGLSIDTIVSLSKNKNIIGIKEATGSIAHSAEILSRTDNFCVLSGDDSLALAIIAYGGHGVISVSSNIFPQRVSTFIQNALDGKMKLARQEFFRLFPIFTTMLSIDTNPIPIKYAAHTLGLCEDVYRLPMCGLSSEKKRIIDAILEGFRD